MNNDNSEKIDNESRFDAEAKRADKILKYHDMKLNNAEIGKLVDCSRERVRQVLSKFGLKSHCPR